MTSCANRFTIDEIYRECRNNKYYTSAFKYYIYAIKRTSASYPKKKKK